MIFSQTRSKEMKNKSNVDFGAVGDMTKFISPGTVNLFLSTRLCFPAWFLICELFLGTDRLVSIWQVGKEPLFTLRGFLS